MKMHIQQTIQEVDIELGKARTRVDQLTTLRDSLQTVFARSEPVKPVQVKPTPKPATPKLKVAKASLRTDAGARAQDVARHLKEPFSASDLQAALPGMNYKNAGNFMFRWKKKGWLTPGPVFGSYQRTKAFGGESEISTQNRAMLDSIHKEIETESKQ